MKEVKYIFPIVGLSLLMLAGCAIFGGGRPYQEEGEEFSQILCNCFSKAGIESMKDMETLDQQQSETLMYCLAEASAEIEKYLENLKPDEQATLEAELERAMLKSPCKSLMEEMLKY